MSDYQRGQVILVNLEPVRGSEQAGSSRPCVIVSADSLNAILRTVIVCPVTDVAHLKRSRAGATYVFAGEGGLIKDSLVLSYQVRTITTDRIQRVIGVLTKERMVEVGQSLLVTFDLDD